MKTIKVAISLVLLLVVNYSANAIEGIQEKDVVIGEWSGDLNVNGARLSLNLNIFRDG